jgi:hypothetical protein
MSKRDIITTIPLLIVNTIAITGQYIFWRAHLPTFPAIAALGFALALESISVFIAYHAHLAELSNDSAFRLRFGSYAAGLIIGLLNGSHFLINGMLSAAAVGMFILSASSPVLWAIHTRRLSRDDLKKQGLIEDRSVKLGIMRWLLWFPESFGAFRLAIWRGENRPDIAIASWEENRKQARIEQKALEPAPDFRKELEETASQAEAVRLALRVSGVTTSSDISQWLYDRGVKGVSAAYIRQIRATDIRKKRQERRETIRALPSGEPATLTSDNANYRHGR